MCESDFDGGRFTIDGFEGGLDHTARNAGGLQGLRKIQKEK